jgi:outer membrane protein TolC
LKKAISIILAISMLSLLVPVSGENNSAISYDKANTVMLSNNRTIKKLGVDERKAFLGYNSTVQSTKNIKTDGVTYNFFGKEIFIRFDDYTRYTLTLMKEYAPQEVKYRWESTEKIKSVTGKSLSLGLRDLYLGLIKADKDLDIYRRKLELATKKYNVSKLKFEQGLISKVDNSEAEYELLKAEKAVDEARRSRENMVRSLNSFLGVDIDTKYDKVETNEVTRNITLKPLQYYIDKALSERLEIKNLEEEIRLKEVKMGIILNSKLYDVRYDITDEYDKLKLQADTLNVKLEKTKLDIENEIKKAYIEIKNDINTIESTEETIKMQNRSLEKMKSQYNQGNIAKMVLDELEIGIDELKLAKELVIYGYNTKIMKLEEAAGLGPAYEKE